MGFHELVTGCNRSHASETFSGVIAKFPDVNDKIVNFKFQGQGQRPTPVAHLSTLLEIAWLCPGKRAKEFRRTGAVTMCRALGGDLSLVEEIRTRHAVVTVEEQEAFLADTGVTLSDANGQATVTMTAMQIRRELAEIVQMEANAKETEARAKETEARTRAMTLATYDRLIQYTTIEQEERDRLFFKDAARNYIGSCFRATTHQFLTSDPHADSDNAPVTISEVAKDAGVRLKRGDDCRIGRIVARLYRQEHDCDPPQTRPICRRSCA